MFKKVNKKQWHATFNRIYVMPRSIQDRFKVLCSENKAFEYIHRWYWFDKIVPTKECKNLLRGIITK